MNRLKQSIPLVILSVITIIFISACFPPGAGQQQTFVTNPVFHPKKELIAFVSNIDGDAEIFMVNTDGSNLKKLTDNERTDINPVWSPDGERIVFVSDRNGTFELFLMNEDGSAQQPIPMNIQQMAPQQQK